MMTRFARLAGLVVTIASCIGCAGSSGGGRNASSIGKSSDERTRVRAAIEVLGREVGHAVDVRVDDAVVDGDPRAPRQIAIFAEELAREIATTNRQPQRSFKSLYVAREALEFEANAKALWAGVRTIQLRYDATPQSTGREDFDPRSGVLVLRYAPDALPGAGDINRTERVVFRRSLAPRFAGRSPASVGPAELSAYVVFLLDSQSATENAANALALMNIYPRLVDPASTLVRERLVAARDLVGDHAQASSPQLESTWAQWYRAYASTLEEDKLRAAADLVFGRERGDLPGLPAFDHAIALLTMQAQGRGTRESAVLACVEAERCWGPLWYYLVDRRRPERREKLAALLIAAKNPAFVEFVVKRLLEQRDAEVPEILARLSGDPIAWETAFVVALSTVNGVYDDTVVDFWRRTPALRVPLLRSIAHVGNDKQPSAIARNSYYATGVARAARAIEALSVRLCTEPATRAEFVALATQHIPRDTLAWKNKRPCQDY